MLILNAFSLNMLEVEDGKFLNRTVSVEEIFVEEVVEKLTSEDLGGVESAVGHEDTAKLFSAILGIEIPCERRTVALNPSNSWAIVGQYRGPRLPEGCTTLPEGAEIRWYVIDIS